MHAESIMRRSRLLTILIPLLALAGCFGEGDGPTSILGTAATPLPTGGGGEPFDSGLLTNGDFEAGVDPWIGNAANVVDDGGNFVNSADVAMAGQPFDVNLSQVLTITQGETYTLTFKARSDRIRTILTGIGLNEAPFTNITETVNLTAEWRTFEFEFTAAGFGNANSRVLFDMGADTGLVLIDDVSLVVPNSGGVAGTPIDPEVVLYATNGDPDLVIPDDYTERTPFGSGSVIDAFYAEDETYSPALSVFSGTGYGANIGQLGYIGFAAGFAGAYETLSFKVKGMPNFVIFVKLFDGVDTLRINLTSSAFSEALANDWYQVSIPLSSFSGVDQATGIVFESDDSAPMQFTMLLTDIGFSGTGTGGPGPGAGELLTNGDMEGGQAPWINQATVVDDGGNMVLLGVVTAPDPGQPFLVNASQVVDLTADETYTLTFRAKASVDRTMLAGLGLNVAPFTNVVETVPLTTEWQAFTYTITTTGFGGVDSRVLFDMNAEAGDVSIDDVSLVVGSLLTNGDMEAGQAPWINQATVVDDGGNMVLLGVVTAPDPGQPFLVNASQVVDLTADEKYVLTFKAKASVARGLIAGIGLNVAPFTNTTDTVALTTAWATYTCTLTSTGFGGADSRALFDMNAEAGDVSIDDVALALLGPTGIATVDGCAGGDSGGGGPGPGAGELLANGDMEGGQAPWINQATVVDDGGNMVLLGVVTNPDPGQPFLVNASQVVDLAADETYTLTFRAKASVDRTMLAGLGLNVAPFTNVVETVPLTTEWQAFTYTITTTGFGGVDSRVLFDMNAEAGDVSIDDVSLTVGSLLTNGDMEAGQAPWINQATVVDDGGNMVLLGVVTSPDPGQPFLVNASQVVDIIADEKYVLTFKAKASVARDLIAGIGLNVAPFTNTTDTVPLTTAWATYTCTLTSTGFGGADSRALFDMNAEAGDVSIDDVALALLGPTGTATVDGCGGGGGGGGGPGGGELLTNGDFEASATDIAPWINAGGVATNNFYTVDAVDGGNVFDTNLSQVLDITGGADYVLTFRAKATVDRNMVAGFGDSGAPFAAVTVDVPLTTEWQTFSYPITATGFGGAASRVLFDMGTVASTVTIDDVSLALASAPGVNLLTNSDFETSATDKAPWINAGDIATNNFYEVVAVDGGNVFDTNLSQVLDITGDEDYVLTFRAKATVDRNMVAGFGDSGPPFAAVTVDVPLTTEWQTFTYPLTATGFGGAASRVLFDMGTVASTVNIDDVSLTVAGGGGGPGGGDIAVNGGFEDGDFTGWTQFEAVPGDQTVVMTNPRTGTFAGRINNTTLASASIFKQANVTPVSIGQTATVTFSARGSFGPGGVAFAEFFTELSGGGTSSAQILGGGPLVLAADPNVWSDYMFVIPITTDVAGGVTLQLTGTTGGGAGSFADVYYDDIAIVISGGGG